MYAGKTRTNSVLNAPMSIGQSSSCVGYQKGYINSLESPFWMVVRNLSVLDEDVVQSQRIKDVENTVLVDSACH